MGVERSLLAFIYPSNPLPEDKLSHGGEWEKARINYPVAPEQPTTVFLPTLLPRMASFMHGINQLLTKSCTAGEASPLANKGNNRKCGNCGERKRYLIVAMRRRRSPEWKMKLAMLSLLRKSLRRGKERKSLAF